MMEELIPSTDLMPGVERLLLHLERHGVPMAVATGSHRRHYDLKTTRHRALFERCFRHVVTGDQGHDDSIGKQGGFSFDSR